MKLLLYPILFVFTFQTFGSQRDRILNRTTRYCGTIIKLGEPRIMTQNWFAKIALGSSLLASWGLCSHSPQVAQVCCSVACTTCTLASCLCLCDSRD